MPCVNLLNGLRPVYIGRDVNDANDENDYIIVSI